MAEIQETGITWDHDTGDIWIDTRRKKVANRLKALGLKPIHELADYTSFRTTDSEITISFRKKPDQIDEKCLKNLLRGGPLTQTPEIDEETL